MAGIASAADVVERVLCVLAEEYPPNGSIRTLIAFDRKHGQYLLIDEGWQGYERIHSVWAHVETAEARVRIHEDGTEIGIANLLVEAGIPKSSIVLSFIEPAVRAVGDFAVA